MSQSEQRASGIEDGTGTPEAPRNAQHLVVGLGASDPPPPANGNGAAVAEGQIVGVTSVVTELSSEEVS